jgi:hypothetical protein
MAQKQHRTVTDLVSIYQMTKDGTPRQQIASELGITPQQVSISYALLTRYLRGKAKDQQHQSRVYLEAVRQIRRLLRSTKHDRAPLKSTAPHDGYDFLQSSFSRFQESIATFIEVEVNARSRSVAEENTRLKEENEFLKNQIDELNTKLASVPKTDLLSSLKSKLTDIDTPIEERVPSGTPSESVGQLELI